jgi:salicylate hydroxylase
MSSAPIIVVGAGISGLTAALALPRRGIKVAVYGQAPQLGEIGAGVQIGPNGTRLLRALGLESALAQCAVRPQAKEIRHRKRGRSWRLFDLGVVPDAPYGAPYIFIHRTALHRILASAVLALSPDAVRPDARCVGVDQGGDGVTVRLADGRSVAGSSLIGADGVHPNIRACVFGAGRPTFTGCMAWRGVIPADRLGDGRLPLAGTNWIGPGRHVVHYPLRHGKLLNFVGVVERGDWQIESWTAQGGRGECLADLAEWHDDVRRLIEAIDAPFKWALTTRSAMERWSKERDSSAMRATPHCHFLPKARRWRSRMATCLGDVLRPTGSTMERRLRSTRRGGSRVRAGWSADRPTTSGASTIRAWPTISAPIAISPPNGAR